MHSESRFLRDTLRNLYARESGFVGFIDESYRFHREDEFPFYTVTALVMHVRDLDNYRAGYVDVAQGKRWHTTEMNKVGKQHQIKKFIAVVAQQNQQLVISIQLDIRDDDIEHARRECLVQAVSRLTQLGCNLVVYERREDNKKRNADIALFTRAKRDGFIPRNIKVFACGPSSENLLWGPDLVGWALRRYLATNESEWLEPLITMCEVIDASQEGLMTKGPRPAAAMGPGPESSVDPEGEGKRRSSHSSMSQTADGEKPIFSIFSHIMPPTHNPTVLAAWLREQFPKQGT